MCELSKDDDAKFAVRSFKPRFFKVTIMKKLQHVRSMIQPSWTFEMEICSLVGSNEKRSLGSA